jgi:cytoskeleton protein RodZ
MLKTIGEQLRQIRQAQDLALETVAHKTHISLVYLQAIEAGDEEALPSQVQMRGFLRLYAHELGVNLEYLQASSDAVLPLDKDTVPEVNLEEESLPLTSEVLLPDSQFEPEIEEEQPVEEDSVQAAAGTTDAADESEEPRESAILFKTIGEKIRQRRVLLSLSIQDIHENIHIRINYIEAIEKGKFDQLPTPVQAKGMLVNYATFLNMDTSSLLQDYTDALQLQRIEKQNTQLKSTRRSARALSPGALRLRNFFSLDLLVITTLIIAFSAFVIWGVNRILSNGAQLDIENEIPGVSDVLLATDTPTPAIAVGADPTENNTDQDTVIDIEEPGIEAEPLFTPVMSTDPINIILVPRQRLWVQVTVDDVLVFQGRLLPGNAYDYSGEEQIDILTGNAGALQILFNNQDIGSLGLIGQVANLSFTEGGLVLPPPTSTPTVTETPQTTPTPIEIDD